MSLSDQAEIRLQDLQLVHVDGLSSDTYTNLRQGITKWVLLVSISANDRRK